MEDCAAESCCDRAAGLRPRRAVLAGEVRLCPSLKTWLPRVLLLQVVPMEAEAGTLISGFHLHVSDVETEAQSQKDHKQ